ncbi:MAG: hypothetical protein SFX73_19990 [Kofleriaceae bacterium]|nr:hypothetical protein [Kofleriaceae bacterium]
MPSNAPLWVKLSLWGLESRTAVLGFMWFCVLAALGFIAYAVSSGEPQFYAGTVFLAAAFPYWRAVKWMDRNDGWTHWTR